MDQKKTRVVPPELGSVEREAWNKLFGEEWDLDPNQGFTLNETQLARWYTVRDEHVASKLSEDFEKLSAHEDETEETSKRPRSKTVTMTGAGSGSGKEQEIKLTDEEAKLFRHLASAPDDFDGNRKKFAHWWANMQMYLLGYSNINNVGRIIGVLSRCVEGEAAIWAEGKKQEIIDGTLRDWNKFKDDIEERFTDPIRVQTALNDIHNFVQGKTPVQTYLDKFESLKALSKIDEPEALDLVK